MKNVKNLLLAGLAILAVASCKKEANLPTSETLETDELVSKVRTISPEFQNVQMCTELYPEGTSARAAAVRSKKWQNGSVITVRMYGGTTYIRNKVIKYAQSWSNYANVTFKFVTKGAANIRITFTKGGSYSYIGTDALSIPSNEETMNYGWLTSTTEEYEFSRVITHEFGHALGLIHEHQHPLASIPWNKPKVYQYYAETQGWSTAQVDNNLFNLIPASQTQYSAYDTKSIMHYPVSKELTDGVYEVGFNTVLSSTDKTLIAAAYPKN